MGPCAFCIRKEKSLLPFRNKGIAAQNAMAYYDKRKRIPDQNTIKTAILISEQTRHVGAREKLKRGKFSNLCPTTAN